MKNKINLAYILLATILLLGYFLINSKKVEAALSWSYPNYNVEISINTDTSFKVKETATFRFTGELNGLRRDITLHDEERSQYCASSGDATCGGFEFLTIDSVTVNGDILDQEDYEVYELTDEITGSRYLRVEKRLYPNATEVKSEEHTWTIEYTVYGGIRNLLNENLESVPFFYWNVLPEDRGGTVLDTEIIINFPDEIVLDNERAFVYSDEVNDFYVQDNSLRLVAEDLLSYTPVTVSYEFLKKDLFETASILLDFKTPILGVDTYFNGNLLPEGFGNQFEYAPTGEHEIKFERFGYITQIENIILEESEVKSIVVDMRPNSWMNSAIYGNWALFLIGVIGIPYAIYYSRKRYKKYGVDENRQKTIIPMFKPPADVRPYLLGSIVDEKVDKSDITGTIIDLAYRGFIKIKEIKKGKEYELYLLDGKEGENLDEIESKIIKILFGNKDKINTKDLTYTTVKKFFNLKNDIYQLMVDRNYFKKSPESTRNNYYAMGIILFILGIITSILFSVLITMFIGQLTLFTIGLAIFTLGVSFTILARFMPAKTKEGSKIFAEVLGFKMFLHTAERYRLKDLKPDDFEKYLSYAVVLGVEKDWAKSFEGIYNQTPEWYEGQGDLLDAYILSSWVRSFNNSTNRQFNETLKPSSGSGAGGGWSGGSSFGGFSGGGGGGGSSGGW